jgi:exosortase A-associated hydrolase 2
MNPFYFGDRARRLFGIYHAGNRTEGPPRAVVLCNSWGPDYIYSHRTIRQAAIQLAAAGFHVLRFDYFGTGDSAGELTEASLALWVDDIRLAIREVSDMSGAGRVMLIGLRLGALLAARVAATDSAKVDHIILWDPIVDGSAYLAELFRDSRAEPEPFREPRTRPQSAGGGHEMHGFPLTDAMAADIRELDLGSVGTRLPAHCAVLVSTPKHEAAVVLQRLLPPLDPTAIDWIPAFPCWANQWPPILRSLPVEVLRRLVERAQEMFPNHANSH